MWLLFPLRLVATFFRCYLYDFCESPGKPTQTAVTTSEEEVHAWRQNSERSLNKTNCEQNSVSKKTLERREEKLERPHTIQLSLWASSMWVHLVHLWLPPPPLSLPRKPDSRISSHAQRNPHGVTTFVNISPSIYPHSTSRKNRNKVSRFF